MIRHTSSRAKLAALAVPLTIGLLASGCGGGSDDNGAESTGEAERTDFSGEVIRVFGAGTDFNDLESARMDPVFEERTGATVEWTAGAPDENLAKLLAALGGEPPADIVYLNARQQLAAAEAGVINEYDWSEFIENYDQFPDAAVPNEGYGPAFEFLRVGFCVNATAFAENNIEMPTSYEGWSDPALQGRLLFPDPSHPVWPSLMAGLASTLGADWADPAPAMELIGDLEIRSLFSSSSDAQAALSAGDAWAIAGFVEGRCLGVEGTEFVPLNFEIEGTEYPYLALGDHWDIVANTPNEELAKIWLDIAYVETALADAELPGYIPSREDVRQMAIEEFPDNAEVLESATPDTFYLSSWPEFVENQRAWTDAFRETVTS